MGDDILAVGAEELAGIFLFGGETAESGGEVSEIGR